MSRLAALLAVLCCTMVGGNTSNLLLYPDDYLVCAGPGIAVPHRVPDLREYGWDPALDESVKQTGTYMYYTFPNYNQEIAEPSTGGWWLLTVYSLSEEGSEIPIPTKCVGWTNWYNSTSVRLVGSAEDYRTPAVTFYASSHFHHEDGVIFEDSPSLPFLPNSLILTGTSPWTFYSEPNYGGEAYCVLQGAPPYHSVVSSYVISDDSRLPPLIQSAKMGCSETANIVKVKPANDPRIITVVV